MNLIEELKNFLASFTGLTARLEELGKNLQSALTSLDAVKSENAELKQKIELAPSAEALQVAETAASTEKARAEKAEADFQAYKESETERINAEAARIAASNGLPGPVATIAGKQEGEPPKSPASCLTGFAKVSAAFAPKKA